MSLYPIKFKPILKERVWGSAMLPDFKSLRKSEKVFGESWEISSVRGTLSVVSNGFLKDNIIDELIEVYMGDLVGEKVYEKFGLEFPLLFKFIGSSEELSLQVHPNDELALERHKAYGKTEMWYIIAAENDSKIYVGLKDGVDKQRLLSAIGERNLPAMLNVEIPQAGDVFYLPAGRMHAIGRNILLAEIQQTSDVTYRVYDWGREFDPKTAREMHVELAIDAIDYSIPKSYKALYEEKKNEEALLVESPYFKVNLIDFDKRLELDYYELDSFVVYMCVSGGCAIAYEEGKEQLKQGETILIPASLRELRLIPDGGCKLLEIYIP
ncbi:MAG: class I mannose-6-phosphate isomerase [Prevotellaceae bacterium]|jgi:mannose-6-phosphate isomerase|nr:class I mannose-6-phosphate isomerase [Prevotellaceae bacterium]